MRGSSVYYIATGLLQFFAARYIPLAQIERLQRIQNKAARLITRTRQRDHITPVLRALHWLPVCHRIEFKGTVQSAC